METLPPLAWLVGVTLGLWVVLAVRHAVTALLLRLYRAIDASARLAGEAAAVAVAWPVEMGLDRLERLIARATDWRERRRVWRTEFKGRLSWDEFERQMAGSRPVRDEVADAASLLGLTAPFTRADLDTRFKRTMAIVHPDKGGSAHLARLANEARALILKSKGWRK